MAKIRFVSKTLLALMLCMVSLVAWGQNTRTRVAKPTVSILGDSYSTFEGFIPDGNEVWYFTKPQKGSDVTDVSQTWWWQVIKEGGFKLEVNESWSGATICNTGYRDEDYTNRSFVTRSTRLGSPDIILICGGTNDSWCGAKMGEYQYKDWRRADLYYFRPAMAKMLDNIQKRYPTAEVYFILNSELKPAVNESVETICNHYGVPLIKLHDIDKKSSHPSIAGMKAFAEQVLKVLGVY